MPRLPRMDDLALRVAILALATPGALPAQDVLGQVRDADSSGAVSPVEGIELYR